MKNNLFESEQKKILIVGGAGYVGLHLSNRFVDYGYDITILTPNIKKISSLDFIKNTNLIVGSVMDDSLLERLIKNKDVVINLAGFKDKKNNDPVKSFELNCLGELNVLKSIAKINPSAHHIFTGTREQFGKIGKNGELINEEQPQRPRTFYGINKHLCEHYLNSYHELENLKIASLRLVGIYGPSLMGEPKHFVYHMIKRALNGEDLILNENGRQIQDFMYIDDLVNLIQEIAKEGIEGIYNVGSGEGISMGKIAKMITEKSSTNNKITYKSLNPKENYLDLDGCIMDLTKIKSVTKWEPKTTLNEGLDQTIKWFRNKEVQSK